MFNLIKEVEFSINNICSNFINNESSETTHYSIVDHQGNAVFVPIKE